MSESESEITQCKDCSHLEEQQEEKGKLFFCTWHEAYLAPHLITEPYECPGFFKKNLTERQSLTSGKRYIKTLRKEGNSRVVFKRPNRQRQSSKKHDSASDVAETLKTMKLQYRKKAKDRKPQK